MALEGELNGLKLEVICECGVKMPLEVLHSFAGYYLGYACGQCGPYGRETDYYKTRVIAQAELDKIMMGQKIDGERNTNWRISSAIQN